MTRGSKYADDPINRYLIFLILRFAVFLLIALSIFTSLVSEHLSTLRLALGYFAFSELLLVIRSNRWLKQGIAIGTYFLDVYALSSLIVMQDLAEVWYLTILALMLGVSLCYNRRGSWVPIALIPSVLILYQVSHQTSFFPERTWEFVAIVFLFTIFAWVVHTLVARTDDIFNLYLGQRRLVSGIPDVLPAPSLKGALQKILERETPVAVDFFSILLLDSEGNLEGAERFRSGEPSGVRLESSRVPSLFQSIKKRDVYLARLQRDAQGEDFFRIRGVESLVGKSVRIGSTEGFILFGRQKGDAFLPAEREILSTYARMMAGWMRQSHLWEQQKENPRAETEEPGPEAAKEASLRGGEEEAAGRLNVLEQENRRLKQILDKQLSAYTQDFKTRIEALMDRESELDQKVYERLAAVELSRVISKLFDLDLILDLILDVICDKLAVESASIMLLRPDKGDLVVHAHRGLQDEVARKTRLIVGEAIAGYVAEKGEPLLIEDIERDPRFVPFRRERYRSGTLLSVPILHEGSVLGVINLSEPVREGPFLPRDLEILQALSRQAAVAIVNRRLYEEFDNGQWIRELYEDGLSQRLSEQLFQESRVLEKIEGEYRVSVLSVHLHEHPGTGSAPGFGERGGEIEGHLQRIGEIIHRHQGDVAGDMGTGTLGIFGLPFPDEGDPMRAVLAAVDLLKAFAGKPREAPGGQAGSFGVSVGVATGDLLFRVKKGPVPYAAFGGAWDRVMILMLAGSPGQILVDEETFERVRDRVHGLRLVLPYGIQKHLTVYGIKGLTQEVSGRSQKAGRQADQVSQEV